MTNSNQFGDVCGDAGCEVRKGVVVVMVAVLLVVLLGCAALAIDIGYLYVARTELQRTADAAAMAGAQGLGRGSDEPSGEFLYAEDVYSQAEAYALSNKVAHEGVVLNRDSDIIIGYLADVHDRSASIQIVPLDQANAVQVIARRTSDNGGTIPLFFASIFGINSSAVGASAVAVLDDRFYAFAPKQLGGVGAVPFAVDQEDWNDQIEMGNGPDEYSFDSDMRDILVAPDGINEIKLFAEKLGPSEAEENDGAGNFGVLHIGSGSLGTSTIVNQINNGISGDDFVSMTGERMIKFYNQVSDAPVVYNAVSYDISGDPGLKTGMENAMEAKIGKVVGFFIHDGVVQTGSNATFNIVGMRFGRVMSVELHGGDKAIIIQPVPYYGPDIITSPHVPSTDRLIGRLELVR